MRKSRVAIKDDELQMVLDKDVFEEVKEPSREQNERH